MSVPVDVLPEARQDIIDGRSFIDQGRSNSGAAFAAEVLATLGRIGDMPEMYGETQPGMRAAMVRRFGYVVYYRVLPHGVEVIAVVHGSRDPSFWQGRV